jgi:3-deoxy-D-manno-octulosonic-acid transferase
MISGRRDWKDKIKAAQLKGKVVWFHCASLGEFEQGRPIMEAFKNQHPDISLVITFFSPSGYEVQKDYELADLILYLPFDTPGNAKDFIQLLKPNLAIFVKYEFWYNFLLALKDHNIPTLLVSAIFRPDQQFFRKGRSFFRDMLNCFDHFFVQNENSKKLLSRIGLENVTIAGDTRFDRVRDICSNPKTIEIARKFAGDEMVMVIGSSWPEDMEVLYPQINDELPLKFIIAPHEIEKEKIDKLAGRLKCKFQLYSNASPETISSSKVLVIDNIGLLSSLYQYGQLAYIGGAFGDGLHNILEAATFGLPIIFGKGKDNHKYQEALDLVLLGGAFEVSHSSEVNDLVVDFLDNPDKLKSTGAIAFDYVNKNAGATTAIMNHIHQYLR